MTEASSDVTVELIVWRIALNRLLLVPISHPALSKACTHADELSGVPLTA